MRCLALAETMSGLGWNPLFLSAHDTTSTAPALGRSGYRVVAAAPETSGVEQAASAGVAEAGFAVIDHYGLGETHERELGARAAALMVFEDMPSRRHNADFLVDPTPGREAGAYADVVAERTRLLTGSKYALVRRAWREIRRARLAQENSQIQPLRIVVSMGASDPTNATARVLDAIADAVHQCSIDVVLGTGAPHLDDIRRRQNARIRLHVDPQGMPALLSNATLAIAAPGSSSFERALLGLPSILVPVAGNQVQLGAALEATGAAEVLRPDVLNEPAKLRAAIQKLIDDEPRRRAMAEAALKLCDGRGTVRVLTAIAGDAADKEGTPVSLRLAESEDCTWLLALQRRPETRRYSRNPDAPSAKEHQIWFDDVLSDPDRLLTIVESQGAPLGYIRLDRKAPLADSVPRYEISIAIDPNEHGRGLGSAALGLARRLAPGAVIDAAVQTGNLSSNALFRRAGYRDVGAELYRSLPQ